MRRVWQDTILIAMGLIHVVFAIQCWSTGLICINLLFFRMWRSTFSIMKSQLIWISQGHCGVIYFISPKAGECNVCLEMYFL